MDFAFTPDQVAFRSELIESLHRILPPDWERDYESLEANVPFQRGLFRQLGAAGLIAPGWPVEHGGRGYGQVKQAIYNEVMAYHHVPVGSLGPAVELAGPVLMLHGSEEHKAHLRAITRGEEVWLQCFTEPTSGSDLGSLSTMAALDGDDYVINGRKIGSGEPKGAMYGTLLARTDPDAPGREGISFFVFEANAPGIRFEPKPDLAGGLPFNHVVFEDVRIPRSNLVGGLNNGWSLAQTTLDFERSSIGFVAHGRRLLDRVTAEFGDRLDAIARARIAGLRIELEAARWLAYRVPWLQEAGQRSGTEASIAKLFGSELLQRVARAAVELLGPYGALLHGSPREADGEAPQAYLASLSATIGAGTSEIQRMLIAWRGLGLPRE